MRPPSLVGKSRYERRLQGLTCREIAEQDGCNEWAVAQSVKLYAERTGLPPVPSVVAGRLTSSQLARALEISEDKVHRLQAKGILVGAFDGKRNRFDLAAARRAIADAAIAKAAAPMTERTCYICGQAKPIEQFPVIRFTDKRCKPGYSRTAPSYDCRDCRKEQRREWRRKKAQEAGKPFVPHGDREEFEAKMRTARAQRKTQRAEAERLRRQAVSEEARGRREAIAGADELQCYRCRTLKARGEFQPSRLTVASSIVCRTCSGAEDAVRFQKAREELSDAYVKRVLVKYLRVPARHIPDAMVEAKRLQMQIERLIPSRASLATTWLQSRLRAGPVDAETLNHEARQSGFDRNTLRDARRAIGASYEATNMQWRIA